MAKIKYNCKNCNWETSILEEWGDLKPKRCMNKRCNTSFILNPDALLIEMPKQNKEDASQKSTKQPIKSKKQESVKSDE